MNVLIAAERDRKRDRGTLDSLLEAGKKNKEEGKGEK